MLINTQVIFREDKKTHEVIALFPYNNDEDDLSLVRCYTTGDEGFHSRNYNETIKQTSPTTVEKSKDCNRVADMLNRGGYNLRIIKRKVYSI